MQLPSRLRLVEVLFTHQVFCVMDSVLLGSIMSTPYWPFLVLLTGIVVVVLLIAVLRVHAFIALMLAAIVVGLMSNTAEVSTLLQAVETPMVEFGVLAGKIGFVIALAAIIGTAMMESGAADKIVSSLINVFGESRASIALILSSFILSIPVFFDTVFFLLIPLALALRQRTGGHYLLFIMSIAGGAAITHSLVPPTPGPLTMAEELGIDMGMTIMAGLMAGIIPGIVVYIGAKQLDKRLDFPFRPQVGHAEEAEADTGGKAPSLFLSFLPIVLPVLMISQATIVKAVMEASGEITPEFVLFIGDKNLAMFVGTTLALWLWARRKGWKIQDLGDAVGEPLQIAGVIILITCAGGAFGAMIKYAGIGDAVEWATAGFAVNYILLAWIISAVMKVAQGSSTVAMITTASIFVGIMASGEGIPYHPIYILLAIGFGSMFVSWMNDSGFWVVAKLSGFTERETLQSWTVLLGSLGVVGLIQLLIFSAIFPMVG